jgi:hypothetical protein
MLKEYQELLATLQKAQSIAGSIHRRGGPTDRVYRGLAHPIREVEARIAYMRDVAEREKAKAEAAKAEAAVGKDLAGQATKAAPGDGESAKAATPANASKAGARGDTRPPKEK